MSSSNERPKEEKWELIDGVPMQPPTLVRQRICRSLGVMLNLQLARIRRRWLAAKPTDHRAHVNGMSSALIVQQDRIAADCIRAGAAESTASSKLPSTRSLSLKSAKSQCSGSLSPNAALGGFRVTR
ncbi:MAG: hypothetical protein CTY20_12445 [Hyphomicrobium sp.]|nr:MAG: hypothetical protein CTY20_12445 [Hyphomicrobium sp.]